VCLPDREMKHCQSIPHGEKTMPPRCVVLIVFIMLSLSGGSLQALTDPVRANSKGVKLEAPAGTIIPLELRNLISSRTAYVEEAIYCETIYPVVVNNRIVIPEGSYVKGEVTDVVWPGRIKGKASINIRFTSITLPDGFTQPLSASVYSIAGSRLEGPKPDTDTTDQQASQDIAVGGTQDAVIDASGLGGGSPISAVSQGIGGVIMMLATRGKTITMRPGTNFEIRLITPLSLEKSTPASSTPRKKTRPPVNP